MQRWFADTPGRASIQRLIVVVGLLSLALSLLSGCGGSGSSSAFITEPAGGTFYFYGTASDPQFFLTYPPNSRNVTLVPGIPTNVPADPSGYTHLTGTAYSVAPPGTVIVPGVTTTSSPANPPATLSIVLTASNFPSSGSPNSAVELQIFTYVEPVGETPGTWVPLPGSLKTVTPSGASVTLTGDLFTGQVPPTNLPTDSGLSSSGIYEVFENTQTTSSSLAKKS